METLIENLERELKELSFTKSESNWQKLLEVNPNRIFNANVVINGVPQKQQIPCKVEILGLGKLDEEDIAGFRINVGATSEDVWNMTITDYLKLNKLIN